MTNKYLVECHYLWSLVTSHWLIVISNWSIVIGKQAMVDCHPER